MQGAVDKMVLRRARQAGRELENKHPQNQVPFCPGVPRAQPGGGTCECSIGDSLMLYCRPLSGLFGVSSLVPHAPVSSPSLLEPSLQGTSWPGRACSPVASPHLPPWLPITYDASSCELLPISTGLQALSGLRAFMQTVPLPGILCACLANAPPSRCTANVPCSSAAFTIPHSSPPCPPPLSRFTAA